MHSQTKSVYALANEAAQADMEVDSDLRAQLCNFEVHPMLE